MTKKKVKKIARKQINKLAPRLSVASAASATNATNAANAELLDGVDSTELSPGAGESRTADLALTTSDQTVLSTTVRTPGSTLLASAAVEFQGDADGEDQGHCSLRVDGTTSSPEYSADQADSSHDRITLSPVWAQAVGAGAHTVELRCRSQSAGNSVIVNEAGLIVTAHL